ncbi:MAG: hypothetical protein JSW18_00185, partial [Candidatus Omnitrophota bacterium]
GEEEVKPTEKSSIAFQVAHHLAKEFRGAKEDESIREVAREKAAKLQEGVFQRRLQELRDIFSDGDFARYEALLSRYTTRDYANDDERLKRLAELDKVLKTSPTRAEQPAQ